MRYSIIIFLKFFMAQVLKTVKCCNHMRAKGGCRRVPLKLWLGSPVFPLFHPQGKTLCAPMVVLMLYFFTVKIWTLHSIRFLWDSIFDFLLKLYYTLIFDVLVFTFYHSCYKKADGGRVNVHYLKCTPFPHPLPKTLDHA